MLTAADLISLRDLVRHPPGADLFGLLPPVPVGAVEQRIVKVEEDFLNDCYQVHLEYLYPLGQLSMGL